MLIADLQSFLKSLGAFAASQNGKSSTEEIDLLVEGLQPFRDREVRAFLQLLTHAAGVDPATVPGLFSGPAKKKPAAPKAAKQPLKTAADAAAIAEAGRTLNQLYERASDPSLTYEQIAGDVKRIHDEFDVPGLKEVAKAFAITTGITSKKACLEKIVAKISDRKGASDRGREIARAATPISPPVGEALLVDSEAR